MQQRIHPSLVRAYRRARYEIFLPDHAIAFMIGQASPEVAGLMRDAAGNTAALLTACNPRSRVVSDAENRQANTDLHAAVASGGRRGIATRASAPDGQGPAEAGLLVLGIPQHRAESLADRFEQNAFVWFANLDAFASLRLRGSLEVPDDKDLLAWVQALPAALQAEASRLKPAELAWLMTVPGDELAHWLQPDSWDINEPWPLAKPDGSAMGIGTELDRMFRIVAAGQVAISA